MKFFAVRENHLYSKAYAKGKKFVGRRVVVYILPDYTAARLARANPMKQKINRIGITVTKKLGCAVVRNRAKRIIREGYRRLEAEGSMKKGFLVILVARTEIIGAKSGDVYADLSAAFRKLGMTAQ